MHPDEITFRANPTPRDDDVTISRDDLRRLTECAGGVRFMWGDNPVMVRAWAALGVATCEDGYPIAGR